MFEIRSEWSIEASRKTFRRENPSGTIGGETPFATYLTVPRKPTSSLITQRNLPTFPRNPRKETKAKIEGARKEQRFLSPFPTSPKNRFFHFFSSYFLSHIYIYFFLFGDDIFTFLRLFAEHLYIGEEEGQIVPRITRWPRYQRRFLRWFECHGSR